MTFLRRPSEIPEREKYVDEVARKGVGPAGLAVVVAPV
ncbi:hypothetical protein SNL152K_6259 [Streptomyces sp. NL15-2K]|nr:hypothetical protein SNL152K_6259 [Streptomyces sp. NL15-2K]